MTHDSKNKLEKPIKHYLHLFNNTSLKHMSIRSRFVIQPNNKLNSNSKQLFNAIDLSPIPFDVILPSKLRDKNSTKNLRTLDEKKILKHVLSKYYEFI